MKKSLDHALEPTPLRVRLHAAIVSRLPDEKPMTDKITVRPAKPADLADINAIYNHYIAHSTCVWETTPCSEGERKAWYLKQ